MVVHKSDSAPSLGPVVTKDFSKSEAYLEKIKPYVADRRDNYQFYPMFKPEKDNLDFRWRKVNRESFLLKNYGHFPRPPKETFFDDKTRESYDHAREHAGRPRSRSPGQSPKRIHASNYENQKSGEEIYQQKARARDLGKMDNFELAQMKLKEDTYYVPPDSKYQAPHPLSNTRNHFEDDPTVNMKKVLGLRASGGAVIPTSKSLTDIRLATDRSKAVEFQSVKQLHKCRKKHMRPIKAPYEKYAGTMTLGSQAIGWAQDNPSIKVTYKGPEHGIADSAVTQFYHNMKMTNMEAVLRYEG